MAGAATPEEKAKLIAENFTSWEHEKEVNKYLRRIAKLCREDTFELGIERLLEFARETGRRPKLVEALDHRVFGLARSVSTLFLRGSGFASRGVYLHFYEELPKTGFPFTKKQKANLYQLLKMIKNPPKKAEPALPATLDQPPAKRIRRAETVLGLRTGRIALVLDMTYNVHNQCAMLRTAELFGVQNVYIVLPLETTNIRHAEKVTRGSERWLTTRIFKTSSECVTALRAEGREIWVADVGPTAEELVPEIMKTPFPKKVAIVLGREATGPSKAMLEAADRIMFLPQHGFMDSFNVSVACALLLQFMFLWCPEARGDLSTEAKNELRRDWFEKLAVNDEQKAKYRLRADNPPEPLEQLRREGDVTRVPNQIQARLRWREKTGNITECPVAGTLEQKLPPGEAKAPS